MANKSLHRAKNAKEDEFYTQIDDIAAELHHYSQHFKGKIIFCNCDDPYESNFFKYFALNFNQLQLKKLIATCYVGSPVADTQLSLQIFEPDGSSHSTVETVKTRVPHKIVITEVTDANGDGAVDLADVEYLIKNNKNILTTLKGSGDFRSDECIELLKEADIVVTNPPFSLFREYISQLMQYGKKFLVIGSQNAITYKEIFPLIKTNKLWLGFKAGDMAFAVPDYYEERQTRFWIDADGQKWRSMGNICWYTNLDHSKRHEELDLYKIFNQDEYPHYDNYDAIEVSKVADIPLDYEGVMGVPITFLDKYNPEQFEILGLDRYTVPKECLVGGRVAINGKPTYARILIRKKQ